MPVNGIELKEGQVWLDASGDKRVLEKTARVRYPWRATSKESGDWNTYTDNGMYLGDTPSMIDLVTLISEKEEIMKFNPKPGDKIICNNGEEFICCTPETLTSKGVATWLEDKSCTIFGISENWEQDSSWMYWEADNSPSDYEWSIKEIIPAQQEVKQEVAEVVTTEEKTYTVRQIKDAFDALQWYDESFELLLGKLNEPQDPEYQKYLDLKAKFENKE